MSVASTSCTSASRDSWLSMGPRAANGIVCVHHTAGFVVRSGPSPPVTNACARSCADIVCPAGLTPISDDTLATIAAWATEACPRAASCHGGRIRMGRRGGQAVSEEDAPRHRQGVPYPIGSEECIDVPWPVVADLTAAEQLQYTTIVSHIHAASTADDHGSNPLPAHAHTSDATAGPTPPPSGPRHVWAAVQRVYAYGKRWVARSRRQPSAPTDVAQSAHFIRTQAARRGFTTLSAPVFRVSLHGFDPFPPRVTGERDTAEHAYPRPVHHIVATFREATPAQRLELLVAYAETLPELPAALQQARDTMEHVDECATRSFSWHSSTRARCTMTSTCPVTPPPCAALPVSSTPASMGQRPRPLPPRPTTSASSWASMQPLARCAYVA